MFCPNDNMYCFCIKKSNEIKYVLLDESEKSTVFPENDKWLYA